jgi:ribose 5-phosphate isomerase B
VSRRQIITEREVQRAKREGKKSIDVSDAVVTPSGRDAAKVAGVELTGAKSQKERTQRPEARKTKAGGPPEKQSASASAPAQHQSPAPPTASTPKSPGLKIALGADHGGVALKDAIAGRLRDLGHTVQDLGTTGTEPVDYPDFAIAVARAVASGTAALGIMVDGAGIGSSMAANKVPGARAALCYDITTATNAREHNNANVLTLGGGLIGKALALAIVETFITVPFAGGRHAKRVQKIDALDEARGPR